MTDLSLTPGSISPGPRFPPAKPGTVLQPLPDVGREQNLGSPAEAQGRIVPIR